MAAIFAFIIIVICVFGGFGFVLYRRLMSTAREGKPSTRLPFKWKYILAPLVLLVIAVIAALLYYGKLPFQIPYHFDNTGAADGWILPQFAVAIGIGIQAVLVVISFFIVQTTRRMATLITAGESTVKPETIITITGNIPAFLQLVFLFLMLNIFHFAAFNKYLLPMWVFLVIVIALATVGFIAFSIFIAVKALRSAKS
ncbi:MAG: DUF1648 domain-containing protein [Dehalococcoidales bacterium]|nr:DUF1648 domain-containing protein [Dehalococcoidales bacterium]